MRRRVAPLALLAGLAACAAPRETILAPDEIAEDELSLPEGARAGMWVT